MQNVEPYCFHCSRLKKRREYYYASWFFNGENGQAKWSEYKFLVPHAMCMHESCFQKTKLESGKVIKERVKGQYQMNKDLKCPYFKMKWYHHWLKEK